MPAAAAIAPTAARRTTSTGAVPVGAPVAKAAATALAATTASTRLRFSSMRRRAVAAMTAAAAQNPAPRLSTAMPGFTGSGR